MKTNKKGEKSPVVVLSERRERDEGESRNTSEKYGISRRINFVKSVLDQTQYLRRYEALVPLTCKYVRDKFDIGRSLVEFDPHPNFHEMRNGGKKLLIA